MKELTQMQLEIFKAMSAIAVAWINSRPEVRDGAGYAEVAVDKMIEHIKKKYPDFSQE